MAESRKPIDTTATESEQPSGYQGDDTSPANVIEAIAAITRAMPAIPKMTSAEHQRAGHGGGADGGVNYAFRGIEQMTAALQPLLGRYKVVITPLAEHREVGIVLRGKNQSEWTHERVLFRWRIYGPGGTQDYIDAATFGEGLDNGDKATNKSRTMAYKNLILTLFAVADPKDDTDGDNNESEGRRSRQRVADGMPFERQAEHDEPPVPQASPEQRAVNDAADELIALVESKGLPRNTIGDTMIAVRGDGADRNPRTANLLEVRRAIELVQMMDNEQPTS